MNEQNQTVEQILPEGTSPEASFLTSPTHIGRYRIERVLGKGGFGVVYLAHDSQLQRLVAIKVPNPDVITSSQDAEAYLTEARTVANLDQPNIVPVYDVGSSSDYPCFIVSKFIEGTTLAEKIKGDRSTCDETVKLITTIADALHYAHKQGLVHRDIKPSNILLDKSDKPFVVDFGLALKEENLGLGPKYAGTPAYMSPEQARGEGHRVDGRSDIFSLGIIFYEMLVGRRPFKSDTQEELLEQITTFEPRPPRQYDDSIPKELERICLKSLSKRASDRYSTAQDMADDLRHFLISQPGEGSTKIWSSILPLAAKGSLSQELGTSDQRAKVARSTFFFADFKGFTERVRILEKTAGHQAAAEMKRKVAQYIEESFRQLENDIKPADYALIDTAGDGFFFHFRLAQDAYRFADTLQRITTAHNACVTDEIAEHWFRMGAATGEAAWDEGKPVGHVVNIGSRLQSASTGGDFVIDRATYDDLPPEIQNQFGPQESIRDKNDKSYEVYRTAFGRVLPPLALPNSASSNTPGFSAKYASDSRPIKIVPKGLRSFDAHDADFFLELLPGTRGRDGLPDSLRFWKTRIEETDADNTFSVGLIYGPSGCGKSSLVKAGLLPRLSDHVIAVYVEATAEETETRLLNGLRKRCPALPENLGLKETLAALRRGQGIPAGKKVVIVLDQFEQWLHAKKEEQNTELVQALRQCDGGRLQCIVMVRDDFWMATTQFMRELEVRIVEGRNSAPVDRFPIRHAEKVLAAFGRAFSVLPESSADTSKEQKQFLEQAVSGLAQEGKVISVRLALFAEMMKNKSWTPASLKAVGGAEGVGVTFLEETFSANTAPPEYRYHQKAARADLKALLPETGSDIKGHMRSYAELLEASGYGNRPKDFDDLIRILDSEIRLITPTDPEGKDPSEPGDVSPRSPGKYYQLTHDYLVHSLREWLTRKQKETRRGRAELLLADRAAVWFARPENRQLPSLWQWASIRWWTNKKYWTLPQKKMMAKAGRLHALRGAALGVFLVVATVIGLAIQDRMAEQRKATQAEGLVQTVVNSDIAQVLASISSLVGYRHWADPLLREENLKAATNSQQKLNTSLALLEVDDKQLGYLYGKLLEATPQELPVIRDALTKHKVELLDKLWAVVEKPEQGKESQRLRAAAALAKYDPKSEKWTKAGGLVVNDLVLENHIFLGQWSVAFSDVKSRLVPRLSEIYRDQQPERSAERSLATNLLAIYAADDPQTLADLLMDADEKQFAVIFPMFKDRGDQGLPVLLAEIAKTLPKELPSSDDKRETLAKRQANAAVALLRMNKPETVWPLLKHSRDPRLRSYIIHKLSPLGADAKAVVKQLDDEKDITIRRALLLSLGEFGEQELALADRKALLPMLQELYRTASDPGLHAASEWLLRTWKQEAWLRQVNDEWAKDEEQRKKKLEEIRQSLVKENGKAPKQWYVNSEGQTMVVIPGPVEFQMGSPTTEKERFGGPDGPIEKPVHRSIGRSFAIAKNLVTVEEFLKFRKNHDYAKQFSPKPNHPINIVTWYNAADYCNWLSKKEGLTPVYEANKDDQFADGMKLKANYLELDGYRIPTESEWEYACRADSVTSRYYGETEELLRHYGWYTKYSQNRFMLPVGSLKPSDYGLFDMQGNALQWCGDKAVLYKPGADQEDSNDIQNISDKDSRVLRGGSFHNPPSGLRSSDRANSGPSFRSTNLGFRVSRTFTP